MATYLQLETLARSPEFHARIYWAVRKFFVANKIDATAVQAKMSAKVDRGQPVSMIGLAVKVLMVESIADSVDVDCVVKADDSAIQAVIDAIAQDDGVIALLG